MCFRKPSVIAYAAVVGKAENEGPYGGEFDEVVEDNKAGLGYLGAGGIPVPAARGRARPAQIRAGA